MQFNTYTVAGARIACWLANHVRADAAELAETLARYDVHEPVPTGAQARTLHSWGQRLRAVFEAAALADKATATDALLVAARCAPRLVSHAPGLPFHLHYAPVQTDLAARVKALTAAGLAHLIDNGFGERLRSCQRAGCATAFIDTSRNGRRKFCCVRCANQVNVARHRARRRGPAVVPATVSRPA
jgi:predicted RNA-binding Zn ribbon-like protein